MVDFLFDRFERGFNVGEVENPTQSRIERTLNMNFDLEGMTVQSAAFVSSGYIGEAVGSFNRENLENLHHFSPI